MTASTHDGLSIERVEIETLRPHPRNARNGDTDAIADSLRVNGQYRPIVVTADGTILAGNHTYAAAYEIGWKFLDVVRLPIDADSVEATKIMLADNRTADLGRYDSGLLADLLVSIDDLMGTGYTLQDLEQLTTGGAPGSADLLEVGESGYKEQYGVIIVCADEAEQEKAYNDITAQGYNARVVTT